MNGEEWEIYTTRRFMKDYKRLSLQLKRRVNSAIEGLREDPFKGSFIKALGVHKLRIGDYTILYAIETENCRIILLTVFHRRQGYKRIL